jgi:hypothetical protein
MKAIQTPPVRFLTAFLFLSHTFLSHTAAASVIISDSTFDDANWTAVLVDDRTIGSIGSFTGNQVAGGGNPSSYREFSMSGSGGPLFAEHLFSADYNPSIQGAITSFSFSFDTSFPEANQTKPPLPVRFGIAVFQNGKHFIHLDGGVSPNSTAWTSFGLNGLVQDEMNEFLNLGVHPDFSASGAPILFGINVGFSILAPCSSPCGTGGIDNWSVTINPVETPEPTTWALVGPILTLLAITGIRRGTRRERRIWQLRVCRRHSV